MTYGVVSDLHCHKWSTYAGIDRSGVNSRLRIILDELLRTAKAVIDAKGSTLVIAGDIFHVRGSLDPEVLNPTQDAIRQILDMGISIEAIPGNHDLVGDDTTRLGSAIQTLAETFSSEATIRVFNEPTYVPGDRPRAYVPWRSNTKHLLADIANLGTEIGSDVDQVDLFIHAGIDGVITGMPDRGLTAKELGDFGFRNVFAGHYHNYKSLGAGVYSIGASTHQTWSDVGTRAGFLLVGTKVEHFPAAAPEFIDIGGMDADELKLTVPGNYVRLRGGTMTIEQIAALREELELLGAKGVSIQVVRDKGVAARPASATSRTLDQSVAHFIDESKDIPAHLDRNEIKKECDNILTTARAVLEET